MEFTLGGACVTKGIAIGELCGHAMATGQAVLGKIVRRAAKQEVVADALPIHIGEEMRGALTHFE